MAKVPVVKIDVEYVEAFLKKAGISGTEFGKSLGYSDSWWTGVYNHKKHVKPNVARLMCSMYKLDYDQLVVRESERDVFPPEPLQVDSEVVEAFGKWLERVEGKLDKLLSLWSE